MRKPNSLWVAALVLLLAAAAGEAQVASDTGADLSVAEAVIATSITDRQPTDNVTSVAADVGIVYCWARITGAEGEIQIEHVWYHGQNEMARVGLKVAGSNWRTWSSKNIMPDRSGEWRVDIVGADGKVLDSVSFTVQPAQ